MLVLPENASSVLFNPQSKGGKKKKRSSRLVIKNCENISGVEELFLDIKCSSLFLGKEKYTYVKSKTR